MAARALCIILLLVPTIGLDAQVKPDFAAIRMEMADKGTLGRFAERFSGSYVFAPSRGDWPQMPVTNPGRIGTLAVGPLVHVRGQVDDFGKLNVSQYNFPAGYSGIESVRSATEPLVRFMQKNVEGAPSTMNEDSRALPLPKDRAEAEEGITRIVRGYKKALDQKNDKERLLLVEEWAKWRAAFVDAFGDSQEAKAIYGGLDNYWHWRYRDIYEQAPGVVAIGEPNASRARCSGALIAADLVLTAGHCFSGEPRKRPDELEAWIGYFDTGVPGKVAAFQRRRIEELISPPPAQLKDLMAGNFDSKLLDYAIVRIAPQDPKLPVPSSLCLRPFDMHRGEALYVLGYPQGNPAMVHSSARVYLPYRIIDGDAFVRLRLDVETDLLRQDGLALMQQFDASYMLVTIGGVPMRELRHIRDGGQPRMGIIADTFKGNSGGPVFDHERSQCVVGIVIGGSDDSGLRRNPNWKEHERVLPIPVVLEDLLRRNLKAVHDRLKIQ